MQAMFEAKRIRCQLVCVALLALLLTAVGAGAAERMSVAVDIANVRSGPDSSDAVIWKVEKYHPMNVVRRQGNWCLFEDFEGDRGWIEASLLADTRCVIVKKDRCNVRSGPGTGHAKRFTVDRGVPFRVIGEQGDWLQVVHSDGDSGWIHRSLVW